MKKPNKNKKNVKTKEILIMTLREKSDTYITQ